VAAGTGRGGTGPVSCTCTSTPTGEFVLDRIGPVVVAVGAPVNAGPFALAGDSVLH
jgi:hypothetical protein